MIPLFWMWITEQIMRTKVCYNLIHFFSIYQNVLFKAAVCNIDILSTTVELLTTTIATVVSHEFVSDLYPPIICSNNEDCTHIGGAKCNEKQHSCICKKDFPATNGKNCYKGIKSWSYYKHL